MTGGNQKGRWETLYSWRLGIETSGWLGLGLAYNSWMYRIRNRILDRTLRSLKMDCRRISVLDGGCGPGFYVEYWKNRSVPRLVGIDFAEPAIQKNAELYPQYEFVCHDLGQPLPDRYSQSFDIVTAFDMLFHITNDQDYRTAWMNLANTLARNGRLLITENLMPKERLTMEDQICRTASEILDVASNAGLQLVSKRPAFVLMNTPCCGRHPLLEAQWKRTVGVIRRGRRWGYMTGAALYPLEICATALWRDAPSTSILVFEHKPGFRTVTPSMSRSGC